MPGVEILDSELRVYYPATLLDLAGGNCVVKAADGTIQTVDLLKVREQPPKYEGNSIFDPRPGEVVEVFVEEADHGKHGWWEGTIKTRKENRDGNCTYLVCFSDPSLTQIYDHSQMRPVYPHRPLQLSRTSIPVPLDVRDYILKNPGELQELANIAGLQALHSDEKGTEIIALGSKRALESARVLIDLHLKRVESLSALQYQRSEIAARLAMGKRTGENKAVCLEFQIDPKFGRIAVGKNGQNVKNARRIAGVHQVTITEDGNVKIVADNIAVANEARDILEYLYTEFEIKEDEIAWVIGPKGANISELKEKSGVVTMRVNEEKPCVEVMGTHKAVEGARQLLVLHIHYLSKQRELQKDLQQLRQHMRLSDTTGGRRFYENGGRGRREGRGRGGYNGGSRRGGGTGGGGYNRNNADGAAATNDKPPAAAAAAAHENEEADGDDDDDEEEEGEDGEEEVDEYTNDVESAAAAAAFS